MRPLAFILAAIGTFGLIDMAAAQGVYGSKMYGPTYGTNAYDMRYPRTYPGTNQPAVGSAPRAPANSGTSSSVNQPTTGSGSCRTVTRRIILNGQPITRRDYVC